MYNDTIRSNQLNGDECIPYYFFLFMINSQCEKRCVLNTTAIERSTSYNKCFSLNLLVGFGKVEEMKLQAAHMRTLVIGYPTINGNIQDNQGVTAKNNSASWR